MILKKSYKSPVSCEGSSSQKQSLPRPQMPLCSLPVRLARPVNGELLAGGQWLPGVPMSHCRLLWPLPARWPLSLDILIFLFEEDNYGLRALWLYPFYLSQAEAKVLHNIPVFKLGGRAEEMGSEQI